MKKVTFLLVLLVIVLQSCVKDSIDYEFEIDSPDKDKILQPSRGN